MALLQSTRTLEIDNSSILESELIFPHTLTFSTRSDSCRPLQTFALCLYICQRIRAAAPRNKDKFCVIALTRVKAQCAAPRQFMVSIWCLGVISTSSVASFVCAALFFVRRVYCCCHPVSRETDEKLCFSIRDFCRTRQLSISGY